MNLPKGSINDADPNSLSIEQAMATILQQLTPCCDTETIASENSRGRVIAQEVISAIDVPSFRASAMDGYALRSAECDQVLTLSGQSLAGHPGDDHLAKNCAQRITTGARVPDDADCVVQQENVSLQEGSIVVEQPPEPGLHIRNPGSDTSKGIVLLQKGDRIAATQQALLAAHGITQIQVIRKLKIAVFSTGDELIEPGERCRTGQIYDANRALLLSMLDDNSVDLLDLGISADSKSALQTIIDATTDVDLVISSGGVSVGDADYVKAVLEKNGTMNIWKIAMKPGRPLTFGFLNPKKAFFGLPGNPVSAALTCLLFVKPAIEHICGMPAKALPAVLLPLEGTLKKNPGRVEYQRAVMIRNQTGSWSVTTTGMQDSHVLSSLHKANCLIELPVDSLGAEHGEEVRVYPLTHFANSPL